MIRRSAILLPIFLILTACGPTYMSGVGIVDYHDRHGVHVIKLMQPVDRAELEAEVERVAKAWEVVLPGVRSELENLYVAWRCYPFEDAKACPVGAAGLSLCGGTYYPDSWLAVVGFKHPLSSTTLAHEVGHHFLCRLLNQCTEAALKAFTLEHSLPY